jgi:hypothetical protein
VSVLLTDTPVKFALETEVEARVMSVKCKLFSDSQEELRKTKQLQKNIRRFDLFDEENESFSTECAKPYLV